MTPRSGRPDSRFWLIVTNVAGDGNLLCFFRLSSKPNALVVASDRGDGG